MTTMAHDERRSSKFSWVRKLMSRRTAPRPVAGPRELDSYASTGSEETARFSLDTQTSPLDRFFIPRSDAGEQDNDYGSLDERYGYGRRRSESDDETTGTHGTRSHRHSHSHTSAHTGSSLHNPRSRHSYPGRVDKGMEEEEEREEEVRGDERVPSGNTGRSSVSLSRSTTSASQAQGEPRPSKVQIVDTPRLKPADSDSVVSSVKRRSNSNFTVPSISRTSITTVSSSDAASSHTVLSSSISTFHGPPATNPGYSYLHMDTASVVTIASSSKKHRRSSFDTNASTRALAPESLLSRNPSIDSSQWIMAPTKSIASSRKTED